MAHDSLHPPFRRPRPVVWPVVVDPTGERGPTPNAARGPRWRDVGGGFFVPAHVDGTLPEQRVVEAAVVLRKHGALTGWANLLLRGAAFLDGYERDGLRRQPVALVLPPGQHRRRRSDLKYVQGPVGTIECVEGLPCVPSVQAVFDAMRFRRSVHDAVVDLDMTLAAGLVALHKVRELLHSRRSWSGVPGVPTVRAAVELADGRSASPPETRARLIWCQDAGLPQPEVNVAIYDQRGRLIGCPDLFDPVAGLALEYDGAYHRDARQHSDDVDRESRFRAVGIEVARATSRDVNDRLRLSTRLRSAYSRAQFDSPEARLWTWQPRDSVRDRGFLGR